MDQSDNPKALARLRFGRYADRYVTSTTHAKGEELARLIEVANPQLEWTILDVATGGGHTALHFAPYVRQVIGADIATEMLLAARANIIHHGITNIDFVSADAEEMPFYSSRYDLVTCRIAPHHFPDVQKFVREAARVLKLGGELLVQDLVLPEMFETARYVDAFEKLRDPSHHRAYAESEWCQMFREAGLTITHREQIIKRHRFIPWAERQGCTHEVILELVSKVMDAPIDVIEWMQPTGFGTPEASFVNSHLILAGVKKNKIH